MECRRDPSTQASSNSHQCVFECCLHEVDVRSLWTCWAIHCLVKLFKVAPLSCLPIDSIAQRIFEHTQTSSDSDQCVLEWHEHTIRNFGIHAILEPHLLTYFRNTLKTICVREFLPSCLLKPILTFQLKESLLWKIRRQECHFHLFNMNNFFWIVHWIRWSFELRRLSCPDTGLLHLCGTKSTFFYNRSCQKYFRTRGITSWSGYHHPRVSIWRCRGWIWISISWVSRKLNNMNLNLLSNYSSSWDYDINSGIWISSRECILSACSKFDLQNHHLRELPKETLFWNDASS